MSPEPKPKKRPTPRRVLVEKTEQLTPRVRSIRFRGDDLLSFASPKPGAHIKLIFGDDEAFENPGSLFGPDRPKPTARTYTPRRFDPRAGTLDVEFVLHGSGVASTWAENAAVDDRMLIAGPGGGYTLPEGLTHLVIAADSCAVPAAGMLLDALPADVAATVVLEVEDSDEVRPISSRQSEIAWLHQDGQAPCANLARAVRELEVPEGIAHFWMACEARAVRRIRDALIAERGAPRERIHTRGYWLAGSTDYRDGDYGDGDPRTR